MSSLLTQILLLIASAGQLTNMAALSSTSPPLQSSNNEGVEEKQLGERKKTLQPSLSLSRARALFHSFLFAFSVSALTK